MAGVRSAPLLPPAPAIARSPQPHCGRRTPTLRTRAHASSRRWTTAITQHHLGPSLPHLARQRRRRCKGGPARDHLLRRPAGAATTSCRRLSHRSAEALLDDRCSPASATQGRSRRARVRRQHATGDFLEFHPRRRRITCPTRSRRRRTRWARSPLATVFSGVYKEHRCQVAVGVSLWRRRGLMARRQWLNTASAPQAQRHFPSDASSSAGSWGDAASAGWLLTRREESGRRAAALRCRSRTPSHPPRRTHAWTPAPAARTFRVGFDQTPSPVPAAEPSRASAAPPVPRTLPRRQPIAHVVRLLQRMRSRSAAARLRRRP